MSDSAVYACYTIISYAPTATPEAAPVPASPMK